MRGNPYLTGHNALRVAGTAGQPLALIQVIHELGGVSKTQLALEYAYRITGTADVQRLSLERRTV